ncbi:MAG: hypothetical protein ABEK01_00840 [Candidatus Nanohaloarchaea archaeon]
MARSDWYRILEAIYTNDEFWEMEETEVEDLASEVGMSPEEVRESLDSLEDQDLIKRELDKIILTKRGFNMISRRETHEEQMLTQRILLVFVTALSIGTLIQTSLQMIDSGNLVLRIAYNAIFAIIFIVLGMIAKRNL